MILAENARRFTVIALAELLPVLAATPAEAAPNSVAVLLGPSVGYLLAQSDLCQWDISAKIRKTYEASFKAIGVTGAQQAAAWRQARDRQKALANLTAATKAKMKTDTCTPVKRQQVEQDLTD
jgi:hypothetical protein